MTVDDLNDQLDYDQSFLSDENQDSNDGSDVNVQSAIVEESQPTGSDADKKARAKAKQKERKRVLNELDRRQKETLAMSEPSIIADYIAKLVSRRHPKFTTIELQDSSIPESRIVYSGDSVPDRADIKNLGPFFEHFGLNKKPDLGRELVLVLCISAIRVCEAVRALRAPNKGGALKLIKQNKPEYDRRCLRSPAHVAVSTPGRIFKLRELRILDFKRIKKVVVDTSMLDAKQRTVWDIDGTIELVAELAHKNNAQVYLY